MSKDLVFCSEDADVEEAARIMSDKQLRRLLAKDNQGQGYGNRFAWRPGRKHREEKKRAK